MREEGTATTRCTVTVVREMRPRPAVPAVRAAGPGRNGAATGSPESRNGRSAIAVLPGALGSADRAIDGDALLAAAVEFSRELRDAGLAIDLGAVIDFARALALVSIGDRDEVRAAGATVFVRHREDRGAYDRVFDRFWRQGMRRATGMEPPATIVEERPDERRRDRPETPPRTSQHDGPADASGIVAARTDAEAPDEADGITTAPEAWSRGSLERHRQFDRMTAGELRDAERFVDLLEPRLELRRTRRRELHRRGRVPAPRIMLRRNLKTGGDAVEWVWQRPVLRPRTLVVLCDISGSMERHARLLLRFTQALAASAVRTEAFVFGTRLTRVSRLLLGRDRDRALARVADATTDWSGGTRIGECLREFNQRWARRVLRSSAVVVIVSDGWDRGEPTLVGREMARLQRSCHRVIWLNPLASAPGYQPLAAGMAAALPFVDDFVPAGTLDSLERLGVLLSDTATRRRAARMTGAGAVRARHVRPGTEAIA